MDMLTDLEELVELKRCKKIFIRIVARSIIFPVSLVFFYFYNAMKHVDSWVIPPKIN